MGAQLVLTAGSIITMDPARTRAQAVVIDLDSGTLAAVGTLAECRGTAPDGRIEDLGPGVLLPGFIQAHDHPVPAAMLCEQPCHWIAPFLGYPTWDAVEELFARLRRETAPGQPLMFSGLDRLLLSIPMPDRRTLDGCFPDNPVVVFDISGHAIYFNTRATQVFGWHGASPPPDTPDARWLRRPDGTSAGVGFETSASMMAMNAFMGVLVPSPLVNLAAWYATLSRNGFTAAADMGFTTALRPPLEELAGIPGCPVRFALYHATFDPLAHEAVDFGPRSSMIQRVGHKIWLDGSPSLGTAALSVPYLDSVRARTAGVALGTSSVLAGLNHTPERFRALVEEFAASGTQIATHVNGDLAIGIALDCYEAALDGVGLASTDHRWRLEHFSVPTREQCARAGALGISASMSPFQSLYWGDLYDGELLDSSFGSRWQPYRDAYDGGVRPTFHNDGYLSPPLPWLNIQNAVTRRSISGRVHDPEQALTLDEALAAHTINAAWQQKRDHEIGSIEVGKFADLVLVNVDPFDVDPDALQDTMRVEGTWLAGRRIDLESFLAEVGSIADRHAPALHRGAVPRRC